MDDFGFSTSVPIAEPSGDAAVGGDGSGTVSNLTVEQVGGKTSTEVAASVTATQAATTAATADTLVKHDSAGDVVVRTQTDGNNTTKAASTAFVQAAVAALINSAPGALDTLKELADAIGDDANFAATVSTALAGKQPLEATLTALAAIASTAGILEQTGPDTFAIRLLGVAAGTSVPTTADADARYSAIDHTHDDKANAAPVVTTPSRVLGVAFRPSTTRPTLVIYSVRVDTDGLASETGHFELLSDASNPPTTVRARVGGGTATLFASSFEGTLVYLVPANHYVKLIGVNEIGSCAFTIEAQTEEAL
jgi:hypothetical protein